MATKAEQGTTKEILSPAELGERTHGVITDIATKLQGVPEFGNALHKAFFDRNVKGFAKRISDYVYFKKGDCGYFISFRAEPLHFVPREIRNYDASIILSIAKSQATFPINPLGSVCLTTAFTEDQDGKILEFTNGSASFQDSNNDTFKGTVALEKMPEILGDLFAPIKL